MSRGVASPEDLKHATELRDRMQDCIARQPLAIGAHATAELLGILLGIAAENPTHAEDLLELAVEDVRRFIRQNWDALREYRTLAERLPS